MSLLFLPSNCEVFLHFAPCRVHLRALVMSNSTTTPWSDNPNAPKIPYALYLGEKAYFAGFLIGAIFYGTQTYVRRTILAFIVLITLGL